MIRLLFLISTFVFPAGVIACSCSYDPGPITIKDYNASELIVSGKALKVTIDQNERQIQFKVDELFKGELISETIKIYTPISDGSCGLFVKEGEEWIIWAYIQDNGITTNLCTRSARKQNVSDKDLKSLRYYKSNPTTTEWRSDAGVLIAQGELKENKPIGFWKYFYRDGFIESEGNYLNGKPNGKWTVFLDPEGIVTRLRYDKVIPNDSLIDLKQFSNRIKEIQNFKEGVRDGEFIYYAYFSINKPIMIVNFKNGKLQGKYIGYYSNGLLKYEQNYKEGKLSGYERFYHPNGQLKQTGQFTNGQPTGEFKLYNEDGELIRTTINKRPA